MGTKAETRVREHPALAAVTVVRGGERLWGKLVVVAVTVGIIAAVLSGFAASQGSRERSALERGRAADAARWAGQASAWLAAHQAEQEALDRGRRADAARWQAQAEAWLMGAPAR